jgi:hypothetical protein
MRTKYDNIPIDDEIAKRLKGSMHHTLKPEGTNVTGAPELQGAVTKVKPKSAPSGDQMSKLF